MSGDSDLAELFDELDNMPLGRGDAQRRGRAFERLIHNVLDREALDPSHSLRPTGEEVDGAFGYNGQTFLLEAKWRKDAIPASDLYSFKGKVDGKLIGTIGVFISMSNYSGDAVDALVAGKELNIILFGRADFELIVNGQISFKEAMRRKLRYAAERGEPFLPLKEEAVLPPATDAASSQRPGPAASPKAFHFVVEGKSDESALQALFERLVLRATVGVHFWVAAGKLNVPTLAVKLRDDGPDRRVIAVVDQDRVDDSVNRRIQEALAGTPVTLLMIEPNLETWLISGFPEQEVAPDMFGRMGRRDFARTLAENTNIDELRSQSQAFDAIIREISGEAPEM